MRKNKPACAVYFCLSLLWACFILGNSLLTGERSGGLSLKILDWLQSSFPFLDFLTQHILRKMAHFTEFAILGLLLCLLMSALGERGLHGFSSPAFLGLLTAAGDETIQAFVPGRGSSLIDVWIDTAGAATGILFTLAILCLIRRNRL